MKGLERKSKHVFKALPTADETGAIATTGSLSVGKAERVLLQFRSTVFTGTNAFQLFTVQSSTDEGTTWHDLPFQVGMTQVETVPLELHPPLGDYIRVTATGSGTSRIEIKAIME